MYYTYNYKSSEGDLIAPGEKEKYPRVPIPTFRTVYNYKECLLFKLKTHRNSYTLFIL